MEDRKPPIVLGILSLIIIMSYHVIKFDAVRWGIEWIFIPFIAMAAILLYFAFSTGKNLRFASALAFAGISAGASTYLVVCADAGEIGAKGNLGELELDFVCVLASLSFLTGLAFLLYQKFTSKPLER